jgi:transcription elongation factor SPT6
MKRVIVLPSFHNITFKEAEQLMDQMDQGEVIVRPSSKVRNLDTHITSKGGSGFHMQ